MDYVREINAFYDWLETNSLSASAMLTWHALIHINSKCFWKKEFTVAISVLALKTGDVSRRSIERARNELKQKGLITWHERGGNLSAVYTLHSLVRQTDAQPVVQPVAQSVAQSVVQVDAITPTYTPYTPEGTKNVSLAHPPVAERDSIQDRFVEFWAEYPRKKSKGAAQKAWKTLHPDKKLFEDVMNGLRTAKTSHDWQKDNRRYVPYPATWLRAEGWLDEYDTPPLPMSQPDDDRPSYGGGRGNF